MLFIWAQSSFLKTIESFSKILSNGILSAPSKSATLKFSVTPEELSLSVPSLSLSSLGLCSPLGGIPATTGDGSVTTEVSFATAVSICERTSLAWDKNGYGPMKKAVATTRTNENDDDTDNDFDGGMDTATTKTTTTTN